MDSLSHEHAKNLQWLCQKYSGVSEDIAIKDKVAKERTMADVTRDQLIEFINKMSREQIALLTKVANGDVSREDLQQMITQSKRDPRERIARSLLKRAQSPVLARSDQNIIGWSEIAAIYELLGDHDMAKKITYRNGGASKIYLERIKALCEKNDLLHARQLIPSIMDYNHYYGWIAIASTSQDESDYAKIGLTKIGLTEHNDFALKLAVAVSHAKIDNGVVLRKMRDEYEQTMHLQLEYRAILAAMAKEAARQSNFAQSRVFVAYLRGTSEEHDAALALMNASNDPLDIAIYRGISEHLYKDRGVNSEYVICLAHIAAVTGDEKDFAACEQWIERVHMSTEDQSKGWSALALAYAKRGDIPIARSIANDKIMVPYIEAETFAHMARIVLSPDWTAVATA